jgi:hypothetical protein
MKAKYIILSDGSPIIFSQAQNHSDIGEGWRVKSAGKLVFAAGDDDHETSLWVESGSITLQIPGSPERSKEDKEVLERFFKNYYF